MAAALFKPRGIETDLRRGKDDSARLMQSTMLEPILSRLVIRSFDETRLRGEDCRGALVFGTDLPTWEEDMLAVRIGSVPDGGNLGVGWVALLLGMRSGYPRSRRRRCC